MTIEELSERILDEVILHSDIPEETIDKFIEVGLPNPIFPDELENAIAHYGVLGMKWGVRKDRKREDESDQQYKDRMDRESRERMAKADRKARAKEQKRSLRSQERIEKIRTKTQLKQTQKQIDAQTKQREAQQKQQEKQQAKQEKERRKQEKKNSLVTRKTKPTATMSDKELNDAINRLRNEKAFKEASKKPDSLGKKALKAAVFGLAIPIGATIVKTQLTDLGQDYAQMKTDAFRKKHNITKRNAKEKTPEEQAAEAIKTLKKLGMIREGN